MKTYITPADIVAESGCSESKAYKIIAQLNKELEAKGYITIRGKVPEQYFRERTHTEGGPYEEVQTEGVRLALVP